MLNIKASLFLYSQDSSIEEYLNVELEDQFNVQVGSKLKDIKSDLDLISNSDLIIFVSLLLLLLLLLSSTLSFSMGEESNILQVFLGTLNALWIAIPSNHVESPIQGQGKKGTAATSRIQQDSPCPCLGFSLG